MTDATTEAPFIPRHDVEVPPRMRKLPRDRRGFIVPSFVSWLKNGKLSKPGVPGAEPDFRAVDTWFFAHAINYNRCWLCGEKLGSKHVFAIGPMCSVNRITSEPGSHLDCAHYAVKVCPFIIEPKMKRNDVKPVAHDHVLDPAGLHNDRNPGAMLLWVAGPARPTKVQGGVLLQLAEPVRVEWWTRGRLATHAEARAALDSGVEELRRIAVKRDGPAGLRELDKLAKAAERWLP